MFEDLIRSRAPSAGSDSPPTGPAPPRVSRLHPRGPGMGERARMVLYVRVSTEEQSRSGLGLSAQRAELRRAADYQDWRVVAQLADNGSGKDLQRDGLRSALELIAEGRADGLAVSKLDRLSRSVIDAGLLAQWFERAGARLVALDLNIDTATPSGRMVLHLLASVAEWERETIATRTRDGLAQLRAQGKPTGRPAVADRPELACRIAAMRETPMTLQAIADTLNSERVPTLRGAPRWRVSSVQSAAGYRRAPAHHRAAMLPALGARP